MDSWIWPGPQARPRKYVPITWESDRVRADYGHLNLDVVVEDTLVRMAGTTANPANWLGIVDVPDGQYRLEHGLLATEDTGETTPQPATVALPAVNGFEQRLKDINAQAARSPEDRSRAEALSGPGRPTGHRQACHVSQPQDSPGRACRRGVPAREVRTPLLDFPRARARSHA